MPGTEGAWVPTPPPTASLPETVPEKLGPYWAGALLSSGLLSEDGSEDAGGCGTAVAPSPCIVLAAEDVPVEELFAHIKASPLVRGVTFSGGEPFSQAEAFGELARMLKAAGYEVASYTGYTFEQLMEGTQAQKDLLAQLDILVDGEFVLAKRNLDLRFRGSENQRILDVPKSLAAGSAVWCEAERWTGGTHPHA